MDLTREDLEGFDVVVDAFGIWDVKMNLHSVTPEPPGRYSFRQQHPSQVGGAGSLYMDKDHSQETV